MEIPYERLNAEVLNSLIEHFVLREGTDYGQREFSLEEKVAQVKRLLEQGDAVIVFDEKDESCDIVVRGK
ncbi:MAG: hypothetical protein RL417_105 [Pseudomonadota bacterium]|jgi:uncharacterized protein YheU (UPF0270 family)